MGNRILTKEEMLRMHVPENCFWDEANHLTNTPLRYVFEAMEAYHHQFSRPIPVQEGLREQPNIICLCGSVRFADEFHKQEFKLSFEGNIVLAPCAYNNDVQISNPAAKEMFDYLHKRKIDLCNEVFVLNVGGYIGESTRNELNYAIETGKPVKYLEPIL